MGVSLLEVTEYYKIVQMENITLWILPQYFRKCGIIYFDSILWTLN